jgi:hypothetical protein
MRERNKQLDIIGSISGSVISFISLLHIS